MPLSPPPKFKMAEVSAIEDLMREHGIIRRILLVFKCISKRLCEGPDPNTSAILKRALLLFKRFAQEYHEEILEETYVFPDIKRAGGDSNKYIGVLTDQHHIGQKTVDHLLEEIKEDEPEDAHEISCALCKLICMYEHHAAIEDTVVFPEWKKSMSEKQLREYSSKFEELEHKQFKGDGCEKALTGVGRLESELGMKDLKQFNIDEQEKNVATKEIGTTPSEIAETMDAPEIDSTGGNLIKALPEGEKAGTRPQSAEEYLRGSSDPLPLSEKGKKEADLAATYFERNMDPGQIVGIFSGNLLRHSETAKAISHKTGSPILGLSRNLQPWRSGEHEGKLTSEGIPKLIEMMKNSPDEPVKGRGPYSTEDGESFNHFKSRFLPEVKSALEVADRTGGVMLLVCSFRNCKLMQSFIKAGADWDTQEIDLDEMQDRDGDPGSIYWIGYVKNKLTMKRIAHKAKEKLISGVYLIRHGSTDWNEGKLTSLGLPKPPNMSI